MHGFTVNYRARWGNDLDKAEWTEPSYTTPHWSGPHLQRMPPLKSHAKAMSWEGCQAGRQSTALRPGVWPQLPCSQHTHGHPTGGQKPSDLTDGSASLAWVLADPARQPQQLRLLFRGPIVSNSLACPPQGQRRISRGISQWAHRQTSCQRDLLLMAWPRWSNDPSEEARAGVAILNGAIGLRGRTQRVFREEIV